MMSNSSSERSFSKLKFKKDRLRMPMIQERLSALSLLRLESDILCELDFIDIIEEFPIRNARRVNV